MFLSEKGKRMFNKNKWYTNFLAVLLLITLTIVIYKLSDRVSWVFDFVGKQTSAIFGLLKPFVLGAVIAYILSHVIDVFEKKVFFKAPGLKKIPKKYTRLLTVTILFLTIIGIIYGSVMYILPEFSKSFTVLIKKVPALYDSLESHYKSYSKTLSSQDTALFKPVLDKIPDLLSTMGKALGNITNKIVSASFLVVGNLIIIVLSFIFSAYFLASKEVWKKKCDNFVYSLWGRKAAVNYKLFWRKMRITFLGFIIGKGAASIIMGILGYITLKLIDAPYAGLIAIVFGITNMIPYVGPLIGELFGFFIVALVDVKMAFIVFLLLLGLQQIDGFILSPKFIGNKLKINAIWVILSIIIGGQLFGMLGMFFGAPVMAVILDITNHYLEKRAQKLKVLRSMK